MLLMRLALLVPPVPHPIPTPTPSGSGGCTHGGNCTPPKPSGGGGFLGFNPLKDVANSMRDGTIWVLERMTTFWVHVDTPSAGQGPDGSGNYTTVGSVSWLQAELHWFVGVAAVLGLLLAAGRMAWQRRGEPLQEALSGFVTLAVVTGCSVAAVTLATQSGDLFSRWIIGAALKQGTNFGGALNAAIWASEVTGAITGGSGMIIILCLLCILASCAQIAMLYVRIAMLGLLVGFLPLAAAASISPAGKVWFKKMLGWLIAFTLYKPVAACVYAFAFISLKAPDGTSQITGIILIVMAVAALPALMKFVVPMVAAAGGGGGGGSMAIGGALGMAAAKMASSGGGTSSGGSGGESGGPTGAQPVGDPGGGQGGQATPPPTPDGSGSEGQTPPAPSGNGAPPPANGSSGGQPPAETPGGQSGEVAHGSQTAAPGAGVNPAGGGGGSPGQGAGMANPYLAAGQAIKGGIDAAGDAAKGAAEDSTGEGA